MFWPTHAARQVRRSREELLDFVRSGLVDQVTRAANDSRFTQDSLSERLANAGLLPMFGFPTCARLLFHDYPNRARRWPPETAVDRDLDIAISQFAPVRDGKGRSSSYRGRGSALPSGRPARA